MKRRILFALLSLAALGLVWLLLPARESEPVYQGKPLRYWLALYTSGSGDVIEHAAQADEAIRHIGTNAIPTLLEMLQEKDSFLKLKWMALLEKQHFIQPPQPAYVHNHQAALAFYRLAATASDAVPTLVQIYRGKISGGSQYATLDALGGIGPPAGPAATPVLLDALTNSANDSHLLALFAIRRIHGQPEVLLPVLINELKDSDVYVRLNAVEALAAYRLASKPAVPALVALLNDPNSSVRVQATNALKAIDPESAAKAGIK